MSARLLQQQVTATFMPDYTLALRKAGAGGDVSVALTVGPNGDVQNLTFHDGDMRLTDVTLQALKKWRFKPYVLGGKRIAMEGTINLHYERSTGVVSINPKSQKRLKKLDKRLPQSSN